MISIYRVENKKGKSISFKEIGGKQTHWIRCVSPDKEEIAKLSNIVNVPEAEFNEFLDEDERPRLNKEKYLHIIFDIPFRDNGEVSTIPVSIFLYRNIILTLEKQKVLVLNRFEERITKNLSTFIFSHGPAYFTFILLDKINDQFLSYINNIDDRGPLLKKKAKKYDPDTVERIYNFSATLSFFHQALSANHEVLNSLRKSHFPVFTDRDRDNFNELYIDSMAIIDNANVQREMMSNLFNLQTILSQQKLNQFMNKLTFLALIIMIPTLISGIYGMNIPGLPFSSNPNSFWYILGLMGIITAIVMIMVMRTSNKE